MPDQATMQQQEHVSGWFEALVNERRSVRAFSPEPVAADLLEQVFRVAQLAPSNCNTQPWQVVVVTGEATDRLRRRISTDFLAGKMNMDFPYDGKYEGVYRDRQYGAAQALYDALGITRDNKEARGAAFFRNFEFFGAPSAAFIFLPEPFGLREAADVGMYAQNLMLSLSAHGLASCPQTALSFFADQVREELGVDRSLKLLFGLSLGYEDKTHSVNQCRTEKAALDAAVKFIQQ